MVFHSAFHTQYTILNSITKGDTIGGKVNRGVGGGLNLVMGGSGGDSVTGIIM